MNLTAETFSASPRKQVRLFNVFIGPCRLLALATPLLMKVTVKASRFDGLKRLTIKALDRKTCWLPCPIMFGASIVFGMLEFEDAFGD
jgi:hypothetical protein